MEQKYTLELTFDELKIALIALTYETDRLDQIGSPRLSDTKDLEEKIRDMYTNAKESIEHGRSWINAERDRV